MAVLDRETTVDGDTVVDWLRAGTPVCVVGSPAGPRLEALLRDGSATEHFDGPMVSGGDRAFDAVGVAPVESGRRLVSSSVDGPAGDDAWIHAVDGVLEGLELDAE